jgi:hypothetical protein
VITCGIIDKVRIMRTPISHGVEIEVCAPASNIHPNGIGESD